MFMATSFLIRLLPLLVVFEFVGFAVSSSSLGFTYNGFRSANLSLDGIAEVTNNSLLLLTNDTMMETGHAFYPDPITFKNSSNGEALSFSTTFVFAIRPRASALGGLAFVIAPTKVLPGGMSMGFLGLFDITTTGNASDHIFAVELDTFKSSVGRYSNDINDNHVAIDVNSIISIEQKPAGYYSGLHENAAFRDLKLASGKPMQLWVDYDGAKKQIYVTLAPFEAAAKPSVPLLNLTYDLSPILKQSMYVGFSASVGPVVTNHYILGWSFVSHGEVAQKLNLAQLPVLPKIKGVEKTSAFLTIGVPLIGVFIILSTIFGIIYYVRRKKKYAEVLEDWEVDYGPHRFKYKDLYIATRGFRDRELLGRGGFGSVYRGVLASSKVEVAVKRVSHDSRQGIKEFVAEIVSIGRLRHRNLVPLLGYCRRKGELLLVYEYMPNGSLDRFLYDQPNYGLSWSQRFHIIKGVASGLFYLHDGWEQLVVHRDVKASNVLLDADLNGRLGDFGLSRLYDHGTDPRTTRVVGTLGYLAPEHNRTGKPTTNIDVYAFGAFLLEVVCGRRPIESHSSHSSSDYVILVDWVCSCWNKGQVLEAVDPNMGSDYVNEEAELVMKLGLLCSHSDPAARPSMRQVVLYLDGALAPPELSPLYISATGITFTNREEGSSDFLLSLPSSVEYGYSQASSVGESLLSGGR